MPVGKHWRGVPGMAYLYTAFNYRQTLSRQFFQEYNPGMISKHDSIPTVSTVFTDLLLLS